MKTNLVSSETHYVWLTLREPKRRRISERCDRELRRCGHLLLLHRSQRRTDLIGDRAAKARAAALGTLRQVDEDRSIRVVLVLSDAAGGHAEGGVPIIVAGPWSGDRSVWRQVSEARDSKAERLVVVQQDAPGLPLFFARARC